MSLHLFHVLVLCTSNFRMNVSINFVTIRSFVYLLRSEHRERAAPGARSANNLIKV